MNFTKPPLPNEVIYNLAKTSYETFFNLANNVSKISEQTYEIYSGFTTNYPREAEYIRLGAIFLLVPSILYAFGKQNLKSDKETHPKTYYALECLNNASKVAKIVISSDLAYRAYLGFKKIDPINSTDSYIKKGDILDAAISLVTSLHISFGIGTLLAKNTYAAADLANAAKNTFVGFIYGRNKATSKVHKQEISRRAISDRSADGRAKTLETKKPANKIQ